MDAKHFKLFVRDIISTGLMEHHEEAIFYGLRDIKKYAVYNGFLGALKKGTVLMGLRRTVKKRFERVCGGTLKKESALMDMMKH